MLKYSLVDRVAFTKQLGGASCSQLRPTMGPLWSRATSRSRSPLMLPDPPLSVCFSCPSYCVNITEKQDLRTNDNKQLYNVPVVCFNTLYHYVPFTVSPWSNTEPEWLVWAEMSHSTCWCSSGRTNLTSIVSSHVGEITRMLPDVLLPSETTHCLIKKNDPGKLDPIVSTSFSPIYGLQKLQTDLMLLRHWQDVNPHRHFPANINK